MIKKRESRIKREKEIVRLRESGRERKNSKNDGKLSTE